MTLRELTSKEHSKAENTTFMRLFMAKAITEQEYLSYVTQMTLIYSALEPVAKKAGILDKFDGIARLPNIRQDLAELQNKIGGPATINSETLYYYNGITKMTCAKEIAAHFYVRYAGDMFGGQMLKSIVLDMKYGSGKWYDFDATKLPNLRQSMRELATPDLVVDAKIAFDSNTRVIESIICPWL